MHTVKIFDFFSQAYARERKLLILFVFELIKLAPCIDQRGLSNQIEGGRCIPSKVWLVRQRSTQGCALPYGLWAGQRTIGRTVRWCYELYEWRCGSGREVMT